MDPNAALARLRHLFGYYQDDEYKTINPVDLPDIQETFMGLDQWITNGGFLPEPWSEPIQDIIYK